MDNYFILSSKVGDKWTKVTSDMTSVKLETCIHIVGNLAHLVTFHEDFLTSSLTIIQTITSMRSFIVIPSFTKLSSE
jgi:hypothetical protein